MSKATPNQAAAGARNLKNYQDHATAPPALTHGIHAAINSGGDVPDALPGAAEVRERVESLIADAVSDLGGESEVTAGRRAILASQRLALTVLELSSRFLGSHGLLDSKGRPHPLLSIVNSYANTCRLNAVSLGLERRQKLTQTLESVINEYETKEPVSEHN